MLISISLLRIGQGWALVHGAEPCGGKGEIVGWAYFMCHELSLLIYLAGSPQVLWAAEDHPQACRYRMGLIEPAIHNASHVCSLQDSCLGVGKSAQGHLQ